MENMKLPKDFQDFLKLFNRFDVRYLLIGGYAVVFHGYARTTADMDVWAGINAANAEKVIEALKEFGFNVPELDVKVITEQKKILRMGMPPVRIKVLTEIDGVTFEECYNNKVTGIVDGIPVNIISLEDLKKNKSSTGRNKDLADLDYLS